MNEDRYYDEKWDGMAGNDYPSQYGRSWVSPLPDGGGWLDSLRQLWHWDELAAEIGQESQARVALVGPPGAGKSLLFNRLRGWVVSGDDDPLTSAGIWHLEADLTLESLGLFVLADLPPHTPPLPGQELMLSLGDPALVIYLLDSICGVTAADYRWIAALRAAGKPLLVAANKIDLVAEAAAVTHEATQRLGMPVIPISAQTGVNVEDVLLPAMLDAAPRLAVPLGRELLGLRRDAARRVIRQAALFAGVIGVQPVPILDLPFQAMVQVGVVMRVGAAFGYVPTGGMSREVLSTVIGSLGLRYLALTLVKFIPFVGWAAAGGLSSLMTILLGEAAIRYYEAGATIPLGQAWAESRSRPRNPLRRKRWVKAAITPEVIPVTSADDVEIERRPPQ